MTNQQKYTRQFEKIMMCVSEFKPFTFVESFNGNINCKGHSYFRGDIVGYKEIKSKQTLKEAVKFCCDGAYVLDCSKVDYDAKINLSLNGPVVDTMLPELTIQRMDVVISFSSLKDALSHKLTNKSLTCVSVDLYTSLYRSLGAKIGRVKSGSILWEQIGLLN